MPTRSLVVVLWFVVQAVAAQTWGGCFGSCGIQTLQGYSILDSCATYCVVYPPMSVAGCSLVDCICNPGHFSFAISAASQCASTTCTDAVGDVASTTNIINTYCGAWSATAAPALTQPPTVPTTSPPVILPSSTSSSSSTFTQSSALSTFMTADGKCSTRHKLFTRLTIILDTSTTGEL